MATTFNNIPYSNVTQLDGTIQAFDNYQAQPFELHAGTFNSMIGFFTSRGFDREAAESITVVIMKQAQRDGYNPMSILDTLNGLDSVNISALVSEILNYNRYKTSMLGYALDTNPHAEITRNIVGSPSTQGDSAINPVTPTPIVRTYSISPSSTSVNEGASVSFTVYSNVPDNTILDWELIGVQSVDIESGILEGTVTIIGGQGIITFAVVTDALIGEVETMSLRIKKSTSILASASVTIKDTTIDLRGADYILIEYTFDTGLDLDTRTRLAIPAIGSYIGWGQSPATHPDIIQWGDDNVGIGTEAVLFNIINFKTQYPTVAEITIDCRAQWFNQVGTTPAGLKVTLYKGGLMVANGYTWTNPTATEQQVLDAKLTTISLKSTSAASIGARIATLKYNVVTGVGTLDSGDITVYP